MNKKTISKHPPFEEGRRTHVGYWIGVQNSDRTITGITRCSEPTCELNQKQGERRHKNE